MVYTTPPPLNPCGGVAQTHTAGKRWGNGTEHSCPTLFGVYSPKTTLTKYSFVLSSGHTHRSIDPPPHAPSGCDVGWLVGLCGARLRAGILASLGRCTEDKTDLTNLTKTTEGKDMGRMHVPSPFPTPCFDQLCFHGFENDVERSVMLFNLLCI